MKKCFTWSTVFSVAILSANFSIAAPLNPPTVPQPPDVRAPAETATFTPEQKQEIEKIIYEYLINNPEVLVESSQGLQKEEEARQQQQAQVAIKKNAQKLFQDPASPMAGNPNGNVTLVEFFDYQCSHCKEMNLVIQNLVKQNKNLRLVFKELPIFGGQSQFTAKASSASLRQGKYYAFHDALLSVDKPLTNKIVFQTAEKVDLNVDQLKKDMEDHSIQEQLKDNFQLAQALQLVGTPTFVVGNKSLDQFHFIPGATSQKNMQNAINQVASANTKNK